jgi:hypothetical protein
MAALPQAHIGKIAGIGGVVRPGARSTVASARAVLYAY